MQQSVGGATSHLLSGLTRAPRGRGRGATRPYWQQRQEKGESIEESEWGEEKIRQAKIREEEAAAEAAAAVAHQAEVQALAAKAAAMAEAQRAAAAKAAREIEASLADKQRLVRRHTSPAPPLPQLCVSTLRRCVWTCLGGRKGPDQQQKPPVSPRCPRRLPAALPPIQYNSWHRRQWRRPSRCQRRSLAFHSHCRGSSRCSRCSNRCSGCSSRCR